MFYTCMLHRTCVVRLDSQDPGSIAEHSWAGDEQGSALISRHTDILEQEGACASESRMSGKLRIFRLAADAKQAHSRIARGQSTHHGGRRCRWRRVRRGTPWPSPIR